MRHQGATAAAPRHMHDSVARTEATGPKAEAQLSAYAHMLGTTSYTAAVSGDRKQALGFAGAIVERVGAAS